MNKTFFSMLVAGAGAISMMGGIAIAAEQSQTGQSQTGQSQAGQQNGAKQNAPQSQGQAAQPDAAKDKDAYFAALSRCDAMSGVAEKQQCVDTVRKQYGQM